MSALWTTRRPCICTRMLKVRLEACTLFASEVRRHSVRPVHPIVLGASVQKDVENGAICSHTCLLSAAESPEGLVNVTLCAIPHGRDSCSLPGPAHALLLGHCT